MCCMVIKLTALISAASVTNAYRKQNEHLSCQYYKILIPTMTILYIQYAYLFHISVGISTYLHKLDAILVC